MAKPLTAVVPAAAASVSSAESAKSAVSWGAIFAGAVAASALTLLLTLLGSGLGLSVASTAEEPTASGLVAAVIRALASQPSPPRQPVAEPPAKDTI